MSTSRCYHTNTLDLISPGESTLHALQAAVAKSLEIIGANSLSDDTIYTGVSGTMLMYLRLHLQSSALSPSPPFPLKLQIRGTLQCPPKPNRVSPLDAGHGTHTVALLHSLITKEAPPENLYAPIQAVLSVSALPDAAHELLYGTTGLLASLLALHRFGASHPIVSTANISCLAHHIIEAGRAGASDYAASYGTGLPLMWAWHGKYYLGAIHGVAGILIILLQLPSEIRDGIMDTLLPAAYALLLEVDSYGHLPSSLPRRHRSSGELVQLCHGAPGALLLIATMRSVCGSHSLPPELDTIETRLSDCIWEEGLLTKGIPLCHGIAGNAWPWLLLSLLHPEEKRRELYLGRALAFLLHATRLPPIGHSKRYRVPDAPYSLFEGLAGAVCAWSEACVILKNKLWVSADQGAQGSARVLGMPWLGGTGNCGI